MDAVSRYFLALQPDAPAREALAAIALPPGARRVHPQDLHLTVAVLGRLTLPTPEALLAALAEALAGPVEVRLDALQYWPGPRIACAVGPVPQAETLALALWARLPDLGYAAPDRPLRPHVSLARGPGLAPIHTLLQPVIGWSSAQLCVMASEPAAMAGTPRYRTLAVAELAARLMR